MLYYCRAELKNNEPWGDKNVYAIIKQKAIALIFSLSVSFAQSGYKRYQGAAALPSLCSVVTGENQTGFYLTKVDVLLIFLLCS